MGWAFPVRASRSERGPSVQQRLNLAPLGEPTFGFLGEEGLPVFLHFEDTPNARSNLQSGDSGLVSGQQFFRQTDGFGQIPSAGAVFDSDLHRQAPCRRMSSIPRATFLFVIRHGGA